MTGTQTLLARAALGGAAAIASYIALAVPRFRKGTNKSFDRLAVAAFLISRLGLFLLIFFLLHIPARGDIPAFYLPEGLAALRGRIPYRDIRTSYAPLHPFLDGAVLLLWKSSRAIILFALAVEAFLLPLWLRLARRLFAEDHVRAAALLYIASPISLQFVTIDGQDNVIIALLLALATLCLYKRRAVWSGVFVALGAGLVKFLALLYFPVFWMASRQRLRWLAGFVLALVAVYLPFALLHAPLLYPFRFEGAERTASNLPYVIEAIVGGTIPGRFDDAVLALALLGVLLLAFRSFRGAASLTASLRALTFGSTALTLTLLLLSKKSWPPYLMLVLFPLCLLITSSPLHRGRLLAFCAFSFVAIFAHSFWATVFSQFLAPAFHTSLRTTHAAVWIFLLLQLLLIGGYAWLLAEALLQMMAPASPGPSDTRVSASEVC